MFEFCKPDVTVKVSEDQRSATAIIQPLDRGYGITVGNSLRRVLLSGLPGAAAVWIKIDGVLHEFTTLDGVKEDVPEIVLNVKGIVAELKGEETIVATLDEIGPRTVTAGDLRAGLHRQTGSPQHPAQRQFLQLPLPQVRQGLLL